MPTKKTTQSREAKRQRRLLRLQVLEYIERYYPEKIGNVSVKIWPGDTFVTVRRKLRKKSRYKLR